jgi:hypothetical protein
MTEESGAVLRELSILGATLIALTLAGCASEQLYGSAQGWQRNQCSRILDKTESDRCMSSASTSYDSYRREVDREKQ